MAVLPLETERLTIRAFTMDDLDDVYQLLDMELGEVDFGSEHAQTLNERRDWLQWTVMSYRQLAALYQPPYGDRAVVLKQSGQLIGACGFVPCLNAFGQLPTFSTAEAGLAGLNSPEFGLFYAISPACQGQGYATEAAKALIDFAFNTLKLRRVVATTTYDNAASISVMRKIGMRIEKNPLPTPPWLQVTGILENKYTR
jgi:ribosomal-protein-alanine N-acetyltransferase